MVGLIGGPVICASGIAILLDVIEPGSAGRGIATIPQLLGEAVARIDLTAKGFTPLPILSRGTRETTTR